MQQPQSTISQAIAGLLLGAGLLAGISAYAAPTTGSLPSASAAADVPHVSGGIGEEEAAAIKAMASRYALELNFIARENDGRGIYLAGNQVMIRDRQDNIVLDTVADGPILLAALPPGRYTVEAINQDQAQKRSVTVKPGKHALLVFEWRNPATQTMNENW